MTIKITERPTPQPQQLSNTKKRKKVVAEEANSVMRVRKPSSSQPPILSSFSLPSAASTFSFSSISFSTVIHDPRSTIKYTRALLWLFILTCLPILSLYQSSRMLQEAVVTSYTAKVLMDFPSSVLLDRTRTATTGRLTKAVRKVRGQRSLRKTFQQEDDDDFTPSTQPRRPQFSTPSDSISSFSSNLSSLLPPHQSLHLVISHCDQPMDWIWKHYLWNQPYKSMTILTKCKRPPSLQELPPEAALISSIPKQSPSLSLQNTETTTSHSYPIPLVQVLELPNVGRCDHSYSYWMAKILGNVEVDNMISYRLNFTNSNKDEEIGNTHFHNAPRLDLYAPDDLILFMKDNDNAYRANMDIEIPLHSMIEQSLLLLSNETSWLKQLEDITVEQESAKNATAVLNAFDAGYNTNNSMSETHNVFVCGTKLRTGFPSFHPNPRNIDERERASNMAIRQTLFTFHQGEYSSSAGLLQRSENDAEFPSKHRPMGKWIHHLQYDLNAFGDGFYEGNYNGYNYDLVPVCFGGNFLTSLRTIEQSPVRNWTSIVKALSREDNIEEGHYMERLWAQLLSSPLSNDERKEWLDRTSRYFPDGAFTGMMVTLASL